MLALVSVAQPVLPLSHQKALLSAYLQNNLTEQGFWNCMRGTAQFQTLVTNTSISSSILALQVRAPSQFSEVTLQIYVIPRETP
jgi:hypothetical protein